MTNKKREKGASDKSSPAQMTVSDLLDTRGVPLWVRFWLERYAGGSDEALEPHSMHDDAATQEIARVVYDTLYADSAPQFAAVDDRNPHRQLPHEARDFIEEWLYSITSGNGTINPWGNPDMAVMALPIVLDMSAGPPNAHETEPTLAMLRCALKRLTTKAERREFLHSTDGEDAEPEKESAANWRAGFRLSRVLADPRTSQETWWHLRDLLTDFSALLQLDITHPALVRRAFLVMCDARPKGYVREARRLRKQILDELDSISEGEGGGR